MIVESTDIPVEGDALTVYKRLQEELASQIKVAVFCAWLMFVVIAWWLLELLGWLGGCCGCYCCLFLLQLSNTNRDVFTKLGDISSANK